MSFINRRKIIRRAGKFGRSIAKERRKRNPENAVLEFERRKK